jgi:hypothetical protein
LSVFPRRVRRPTEIPQHAQEGFEARRKELLDREGAALAQGDRTVQAGIGRRVAAAHGPNWDARRTQAAELLRQAERASPEQREALQKQAAGLLGLPGRQQRR